MTRIVSFLILIAAILGVTILFYKLMATFILPLFMAALLVVIFRPLHVWIYDKVGGREKLAAGLTTGGVVVIILLPLCLLGWQAAYETIEISKELQEAAADTADFEMTIDKLVDSLPFEVPTATVESWKGKIRDGVSDYGQEAFKTVVAVTGSFLVGFAIMMISMFYFLLDGPMMLATIMRLLPLDDHYEEQLVEEFASISRAVVVATLLSAVSQGLLAGVAYWVVGFDSVFLLTILTMLLALVPFVGAAAIWIPCCLWLHFHDGNMSAAIGLAVYGAVIVSMADNIIKPLILSGRSNLHPLLGLLSVLGGVQALGPIGILVGPMVIVFMQTLLNMLHSEMNLLDSHAVAKDQSDTSPENSPPDK